MVNGQTTTVLTDDEASYFNNSRDAYLKETRFTENTDLRDLDRLLTLELMIFRWQQWLFAGVDYDGDFLENEKQLVQDMKYYSDQINKIKEQMGLNKKARDAMANEGNFAAWLSDLKARAKIFGVHRENQLTHALVIMNELSAIIDSFRRSDPEERRKLGFESEKDIVTYIADVLLPEFRQVDDYFKSHVQRYWIRDM